MNYTSNDKGQTVIAVGAPGSIERAKVEHPQLIEALDALYFSSCNSPGRAVDEAIEMICRAGIQDPKERLAILEASRYGQEGPGTVTGIVRSVSMQYRKKATPMTTIQFHKGQFKNDLMPEPADKYPSNAHCPFFDWEAPRDCDEDEGGCKVPISTSGKCRVKYMGDVNCPFRDGPITLELVKDEEV